MADGPGVTVERSEAIVPDGRRCLRITCCILVRLARQPGIKLALGSRSSCTIAQHVCPPVIGIAMLSQKFGNASFEPRVLEDRLGATLFFRVRFPRVGFFFFELFTCIVARGRRLVEDTKTGMLSGSIGGSGDTRSTTSYGCTG